MNQKPVVTCNCEQVYGCDQRRWNFFLIGLMVSFKIGLLSYSGIFVLNSSSLVLIVYSFFTLKIFSREDCFNLQGGWKYMGILSSFDKVID